MKRLLLISAFQFFSFSAFAAFTEFYVQTTGSNLNSGSTTSDSAAYTATNGGWNSGTGVFTPASGDPSATVSVGNFASVYTDGASVTGFVGRVTAVNSTTITVSITAKSGTIPTTAASGISCKVGGAWLGPNGASGFPFGFITNALINASANIARVNFKSGTTYSVTAAITHTTNGPIIWEGYASTPGDTETSLANRAFIDGGTSGTSYVLLAVSGQHHTFVGLDFANNGATGSANGITTAQQGFVFRRCVFHGFRGTGLTLAGGSNQLAVECEAYGNNLSNSASTAGFIGAAGGVNFLRCISHDNTGSNSRGFIGQGGVWFKGCIADSNGSNGFEITAGANHQSITDSDSYNNGGSGILVSATNSYIENCNLVKNGAWGIIGSGTIRGFIFNCAFGSGTQANTSGTTSTLSGIVESGSVTYASNVMPWVDPANGDFRINLSTAKGVGRGSFTQTAASYTGSIAYPDIGAAQHQETAAAAVEHSFTWAQ